MREMETIIFAESNAILLGADDSRGRARLIGLRI